MRKPLVAGNWKMNKTSAEARELVAAMLAPLREIAVVEKVLCPPSTSIPVIASALTGTDIGLGAQNMHWEEKGAFTGELAPNMVKEFCGYVIIGHSERRALFGETDEYVNRKLRAAMKAGLIPIVCVGETLDEYESGRTGEVVSRQIKLGFADVDSASASRIVVAYEPVWAIGTGRNATPGQAQEVHAFIRGRIAARDAKIAAQVRILYGGSVKAGNAAELFAQPDVDGGLIGGASLKADEFLAIVAAAGQVA